VAIEARKIGRSAGGLDIICKKLTVGPKNLLLIGGVHGDEPEGFGLVERFVREETFKELEGLAAVFAIERLNPDGCAKNERRNDRMVDLNRNMPTKDWDPKAHKERYAPGPSPASEPETKALIAFIEAIKPVAIVSAHSWNPMINYNGPCKAWAEYYGQLTGYRMADDIGYPTPGSLGTWAGWERKIPTITLEIQKDLPLEQVWTLHGQALLKALVFAATKESLG
jgi:murein peptide amidase A